MVAGKLGRFIVDTHVHSQRHAAGAALKGSKDYSDLGVAMSGVQAYDNSPRLIYDMECYGVDMCVVQPAFGMSNEIDVEQTKKYPDKFVANCQTRNTRAKIQSGEIAPEKAMDAYCEELEELFKTGNFVGIGEGCPSRPVQMKDGHPVCYGDNVLITDMMKVMDVCRKYKMPFRYHAGAAGGYSMPYHPGGATYNPLWAHTLAVAYPDVPIVLEHAGIEGGWWEHFYDQCLHVAAGHKNIYLECGRFWSELYYRALEDPSVGPEKLIWGTDWGASLPLYSNYGRYPSVYTRQDVKTGIIRHQPDIWGWSLRELAKLDISQDDLNLILGGNAVRLYNLRTPGGLTRMFKFVD